MIVISLYSQSIYLLCNKSADVNRISQNKITDYTVIPFNKTCAIDFKDYKERVLTLENFKLIDRNLYEFASEYNRSVEKRSKTVSVQHYGLLAHDNVNFIYVANYKRQYICAVDKKGNKIVWVNCFCSNNAKHFKDWRKQVVSVEDGGKCFFNLEINLTRNIRYNVMINGVA